MAESPPPPWPPLSPQRLLAASLLLAAELDKAGFHAAAACAAMAADRIGGGGRAVRGVLRDGFVRQRSGDGSAGSAPPQDERDGLRAARRGAVEMELTLDREGQAWMVLEGDCLLLGAQESVCAELRRFLAEAAAGNADGG